MYVNIKYYVKMTNCIAYSGLEFTIEWYFDENNKSISLDYYKNLSPDKRKKIINLFKLLGNFGKIRNTEKFRHEGDQIYVFKSDENRFFCFFFTNSKIIVTNAYEKQSDKMPIREKAKALKLRDCYLNRFKEGLYYE